MMHCLQIQTWSGLVIVWEWREVDDGGVWVLGRGVFNFKWNFVDLRSFCYETHPFYR